MTKSKFLCALAAATLLASCSITIQPSSSASSAATSAGSTSETTSVIDSSETTPSSDVTSSDVTSETTSEPASESASESDSEESSTSSESTVVSSSEQSSGIDFSYDAKITFAGSGKENSAVASAIDQLVASGVELSSVTASGLYYGPDGCLRLGSSTKAGTMTFHLAEGKFISKIIVKAAQFKTDTVSLNATTEINTEGQNVSVGSLNYYVFDAFEGDNEESTEFSLSVASKSRVYLYEIYLVYGELAPVYPTSISLSGKSSVSIGNTCKLTVSYLPAKTNVREVTFESSASSVASVDANGIVTGVSVGEATITAKARTENNFVTATFAITVTAKTELTKTKIDQTYQDYSYNNIYGTSICPLTGSPKTLVIPVWFTDSSNYVSVSKKEDVRQDIEKAYFGTTQETGWHSVKTFYEEESMGKLSLNGKVSDWYECGFSTANLGKDYYSSGKTSIDYLTDYVVEQGTNWYFDNNPEDDRKDYDSDGDGYLDAVMFIYAAPDYVTLDNENYSNLWAYCYWLANPDTKNVNSPGTNVYFWASYDFMYDSATSRTRTGKNYGGGNCSHCSVDTHTYIHEFGHVLGLDDYYDYGSYGYTPAGGFSMQDNNVGGHDPFSVMGFGWADPYIPTESTEITIGAFQDTHDMILLTPEWNEYDSVFDEYLLLELYTPTGLNKFDSDYEYVRDGVVGPKQVGIRLWHVDARLVGVNETKRTSQDGQYYDAPVYDVKNITSDTNNGEYGVIQAFTNTYDWKKTNYGSCLGINYYKYDLLHLIRNNKSEELRNLNMLQGSDLFGDGATFNQADYQSQFPDGTKLDNGKELGWSFSVSIDTSGASPLATITLERD